MLIEVWLQNENLHNILKLPLNNVYHFSNDFIIYQHYTNMSFPISREFTKKPLLYIWEGIKLNCTGIQPIVSINYYQFCSENSVWLSSSIFYFKLQVIKSYRQVLTSITSSLLLLKQGILDKFRLLTNIQHKEVQYF